MRRRAAGGGGRVRSAADWLGADEMGGRLSQAPALVGPAAAKVDRRTGPMVRFRHR